MKSLYKIIAFTLVVFGILSCDNVSDIEANPAFSISFLRSGQTKAYVGTEFYVIRSGNSEFISVFDGSEGHVYGEAGATGVFFDKNDSIPLTYKKPGKYTLTVVATSSTDLGKSFVRNTKTTEIEVVDNRNEISNFYITDATGNLLYKAEIIQDSIFFNIPDIVTDLNFKPSFVLNSDLSKVFVNGVEQISGQSINNFADIVTYKVVSSIQTEKNYFVKVRKYSASNEKNFTRFTLAKYDAEAAYRNSNGEVANIDAENATINLSVNYGTVKTSTRIVAESSYGSTIYINGVVYSTTKRYNLNTITEIKIVAQNNTEKKYSLNLTDQDPVEGFTFVGLVPAPVAQIDKINKTIAINVLSGTNTQNLIAKWTGTVGKVTVNGTDQINGVTVNNFSEPLTYKFYKGTTLGDTYVVSVNVR